LPFKQGQPADLEGLVGSGQSVEGTAVNRYNPEGNEFHIWVYAMTRTYDHEAQTSAMAAFEELKGIVGNVVTRIDTQDAV
jgi:hypothetical protein